MRNWKNKEQDRLRVDPRDLGRHARVVRIVVACSGNKLRNTSCPARKLKDARVERIDVQTAQHRGGYRSGAPDQLGKRIFIRPCFTEHNPPFHARILLLDAIDYGCKLEVSLLLRVNTAASLREPYELIELKISVSD